MACKEQPNFTKCNDVAALSSGGKILFASDDFFAAAENMLKDNEPEFIVDKFTEFGKWMDGWETRRKRNPGHDWCIIKLAGAAKIKGFHIDTAYFTGNYAPKFSIQATSLPPSFDQMLPTRKPDLIGRAPSNRDFEKMAKLKTEEWPTIVNMRELSPGYEDTRHTFIPIEHLEPCTHLRLNIYPDGGIARFRVYGDIELIPNEANRGVVMDMLGMNNGGKCLVYSNAHYGHPKNLIKPIRGVNMGDGWETARRLDRPSVIESDDQGISNAPGSEWAVFRLGAMTTVSYIEIDTNHFKGNFPDNVKIEAIDREGDDPHDIDAFEGEWTTVLDKQKLSAHKVHTYRKEIKSNGPFNYVRIIIAPDGGISRVRIYGTIYSSCEKKD